MKRICLTLILISVAVWMSCGSSQTSTSTQPPEKTRVKKETIDTSFSVLSFNVLHPDAQTTPPGQEWEIRRPHIVDLIHKKAADIVLLQEAMVEDGHDTAEWMRKSLTRDGFSVNYAVVGGVGTEPMDILINKDKFEVVFPARDNKNRAYELYGGTTISNKNKTDSELNSAYLPPDPLTTCLSAINRATPPPLRRTASWAHLRHRTTQKEFVVANLHLHWKHESRRDNTIRIEQLRCLVSLLHQRYDDLPKIIGGDFNAELGSEELNLLLGGFGHEARRFASAATDKAMPQGTWNGFCDNCTPALKIDHLFSQGIEIETPSAAIHDKYGNHWPSDHCPVIATFKL